MAQAQTCSTPEAQLISPPDGSTLQPDPITGSINFTWCNASADYFVIIESIPGAHDIFFAFTGGAGGGAGQNFLDLGPGCLPTPPTGCIPALGEHIYFTLDTVKAKQIIGSHQYNFTAPGTPGKVATTTNVGAASASASTADQNVTLTATVTAASTVNQGTVNFQVLDGAANVGAAVTSATLATGSATATYLLPAGTVAKAYTIQATYSGGTNFDPSSGNGTLTVNPAPPSPLATTTTVNPQTVTFSSAAQNVTLTATVASASAVNEGTVAFQIVDAATNPIGTAAASATLSNGSASAIYALPAGLAAADYTIQAAYSGGSNFLASSGTGTLTVTPAPPPMQTATATTVGTNAVTFSVGIQHVTLSASVSGLDALGQPVTVNEGTVTFQVMDGATNFGTAVPSATLTNGSASVSYALPAGTPVKDYNIQAAYSGGADFLASSGTGTLTITKTQSTTNFTSTAPASLPINGQYTPAATSTGDGTLAIGASGSCSIAGGVVTITSGPGTCTVTATESEGLNFLGSSATPQTITVTTPGAHLSASSLSFGKQGITLSSAAKTVTLSNDGNAPLAIASIAISAGYLESNDCGAARAAGGTCTIMVSFQPTAVGDRPGTLTLTDNAPSSPQTVTLTGIGTDFAMSVGSGSSTSATVNKGGTASYTLSIAPEGGFDQSVSFTCSGAPQQATCRVSPPSVTLNGTNPATITVSAATTAASLSASHFMFPPVFGNGARRAVPALLGMLLLLATVVVLTERRPSAVRISALRRALLARRWVLLATTLLTVLPWAACGGGGGGGGNPGTPAGTYTLVVTGTYTSGAATLQRTFNLTLIVN